MERISFLMRLTMPCSTLIQRPDRRKHFDVWLIQPLPAPTLKITPYV